MKKGMKRLLSVLVIVTMLFSMLPTAAFAGDEDIYEGKVIILHSNDVHGEVLGYQYMAALKEAFLDFGAERVILVDAGDYSQGTVYVSDSKGYNAINLMNEVGYDVATIGNHEFDYGYEQLMTNMADAWFTVVCANVKDADGETIFAPYKDIEAAGVSIRFIGVETPEAQTKANPKLIKGLTFDAENAMYADVSAAADCDANIVIALAHLGVDGESEPNRSLDLWANTTGLDFIIDGHSHTVMSPDTNENKEPIQSTGASFTNIGVIVIDAESKEIEDAYNASVEALGISGNEGVRAMAEQIIARIDEKYGEDFASTDVFLNGIKGDVRAKETNLGDLITDAMLWSVLENSELKVDEDHVVALTNGGGIRANLPAASAPEQEYPQRITMKDVNTVLPFGNTLAVVYVKGYELLEALEASTYCTPMTVGGFPQIAGMNINVNTDIDYDANAETYPGSTYYGPASVSRVTIKDINGKRFNLNDTYAVVTNNFCAAGGDTYYAFAAATEQFDTGLPLDEVLIDYIKNELGGNIGADYAEPAGRITFGKPYEGKLIILHTNDVHGAISGYTYAAGLKEAFEANGATVILADAGDYSQGTVNVSDSKGYNAVLLMNEAGYDVATIGNHEFDYGYDQLVTNMDDANFTVISANVKDESGTVFNAYMDYMIDGVTVRFIGLETPEAQTKANPKLIKGLTFDAENAMFADVNAAADCDADIVIALAHLGVDDESEPNRSVDLWANITGVDFIIDGHSHTVMTEGPDKQPIQSTGTAFANIGVIVIDLGTAKIEDNYLIPLKNENGGYIEILPSVEGVQAMADQIEAKIEEKYGAIFATTDVFLDGIKGDVRAKETNLGDLITDAMLWSVLENSELSVDPENVVAITNGGGIRANLPTNAAADSEYPMDITMKDVNTVLPFGNTVAVVYVKGSELLEALEASTYCTPTTVGGFPQIAGMNINVDVTEAYDKNAETYPGSTYYGPASINRVTIKDVNGRPFDPDETYAVVTNNFSAAGGDTYYAFAAATEQFDTGLPLDEVLIDYIENELDGNIGAEYAEPAGRITFEDLPEYEITEGDGQIYLISKDNEAKFTCNGEFDLFTGLLIDDDPVDPLNYDAVEGSTVVTLKKAYLDSLATGKHTIQFLYEDGESNVGEFEIERYNPQTDYSSDMMLWMLIASLAAAAIVIVKKRRSIA